MSASDELLNRNRPFAGFGRLSTRSARPGLALGVVLLAAFVIDLDTTIVNVTEPAAARHDQRPAMGHRKQIS